LGGLLSENGPFYPNVDGTLINNPYGWNTVANVLYIESPAQVGFSYMPGSPQFNDTITAQDNYNVLKGWFAQFPQFGNNKFMLSGESYAGHYVPQLTKQILEARKLHPDGLPQKNFRGFMVGNPSTRQDYDFGDSLTKYYQSHGMLRLTDNDQNNLLGDFDAYDILQDICHINQILKAARYPHPVVDQLRSKPIPDRFFVHNAPACVEDWLTTYLNRKDVQTALGAIPTKWQDCAGPKYSFGQMSIIPLYQEFMDTSDIQIMVYSGDMDTVINFIGTESWINSMNRPVVDKWQPWYYKQNEHLPHQVAGWRIKFDRMEYRTVLSAGHLVPRHAPFQALLMLKEFLSTL
jgi:serine carboxypeptidase-like clade 2